MTDEKVKIKKKNLNITIIVILFFVIFRPPILPINMHRILTVFSILYLLFHFNSFLKYIQITKMKNILILNIIIIFYLFFVIIFNNQNLDELSGFLYLFLCIFPTIFVIFDIAVKKKLTFEDIIKHIVIAGAIQGILGILSFMFPPIQDFFVEKISAYYVGGIIDRLSAHRIYGLALNLTSFSGYVLVVIAMFAFYFAIKKDFRYFIAFILTAISGIINVRTGFVILAVGIFIILLQALLQKKQKRFRKRFFLISVISILFVIIGLQFLSLNPKTAEWVTSGFDQIIDFLFLGKFDSGYFGYIVNKDNWPWPQSFGVWVFGAGLRIFGSAGYKVATDIGYVSDIWVGGLIYVILIYALFFISLSRMRNQIKNFSKEFANFVYFFFLLTFLFINIKAPAFSVNEVTTIIFILMICAYLPDAIKVSTTNMLKRRSFSYDKCNSAGI